MPPNGRELAQGLGGQTMYMLDRRLPKVVMSIEGGNVIVGTDVYAEGRVRAGLSPSPRAMSSVRCEHDKDGAGASTLAP